MTLAPQNKLDSLQSPFEEGGRRARARKGDVNILIVGPSWVGDMVMAQSLFMVLKQTDPNCRIDVLAPAWSRPVLDRMPEVHQAIPLPLGHGVLNLGVRYRLAKTLRSQHYDQAIVLPNSWKSALIPWLAKIPKRTGWLGEYRYRLLNDSRTLNPSEFPRMVDQFTALAYPKGEPLSSMTVPFPNLKIEASNLSTILEKLSLSVPKQPVLALCPGAEFGPSKRWPASHYAKVAQQKLQQGWTVFLMGSPKDAGIAADIQQQTENGCIDLTHTTLAEAIDLLSLASVVVTNDSGMMHIAAALNKPVVALYGSTDPGFTPPLQDKAQILQLTLPCKPCFKRICPLEHHRCLQDLLPHQVLTAIERVEGT